MAEAMKIDCSPLRHGPSSFRDGVEFFQDMRAWAEDYEKKTMVPDKNNHQTANETTNILLFNMPKSIHSFGKKVIACMMDERLRTAMMYACVPHPQAPCNDTNAPSRYPAPPAILPPIIHSILSFRRFLLTYLIPPRPHFMPYKTLSDDADPKTGRYHQRDGFYDFEPWYVKPTFWARYRPAVWYKWATGKPYPDGKNWQPEGYHMFGVGPKKFENSGHDKCAEIQDELMSKPRTGCPFAVKV
jgi:hypothetical protein